MHRATADAVLVSVALAVFAPYANASSIERVSRCRIGAKDADQVLDAERRTDGSTTDPELIVCAAENLESRGRHDEAEWLYVRAVEAAEGGAPSYVARSSSELAQFYARNGRAAELETMWPRLLKVRKGSDILLPALYTLEMSETYFRSGDYALSSRLVGLVERYDAESGSRLVAEEDWVPYLFAKVGRIDDALETLDRRIEEAREEAVASGTSMHIAGELDRYADFLSSIGRSEAASAKREEAQEIRSRGPKS
jgi:tetratricopeptide (TPR) repeat protein